VVCNSRFLILPTVRVKHLGSHVLGQLARRIAGDWQQRYGTTPWLMESYVAATRAGTVYRAANWIEVGMTTGRGRQDRAGNRRAAGEAGVCLSAVAGAAQTPVRATGTGAAGLGAAANSPVPSSAIAGWSTGCWTLPGRSLPNRRPISHRPAARRPRSRRPTGFLIILGSPWTPCSNPIIAPPSTACAARAWYWWRKTARACANTMHAEMQGIGPISNRVDGPQGLIVHSALAFRPDGLSLGLLDIEAWARDAAEFGKRKACNGKPIEAKESFKWIRALTPIGTAAAQCPSTRIITLADREADIFEYLLEARTRGLDVVVRAKEKNRRLERQVQPLGMHIHLRPKAGTIALEVPRRGQQPARTAELSVRFDAVTLPPPLAKPELAAIQLWRS